MADAQIVATLDTVLSEERHDWAHSFKIYKVFKRISKIYESQIIYIQVNKVHVGM